MQQTVDIIPVGEVFTGDRVREDYGDLKDLSSKIKRTGQICSICVRYLDEDEKKEHDGYKYMILAGDRRLQAALTSEIPEIIATIYPSGILSKEQELEIELTENTARKDLEWTEEVKAKQALHNSKQAVHGDTKMTTEKGTIGWSQQDTADALGESRSGVSQDLKMAQAMEVIPDLAKCKTKHDAVKMLKTLEVDAARKELAKRQEKGLEGVSDADIRKSLCSSFIIGDFFDAVKGVKDGQVHLVELDPPYAIGLQDIKNKADDITKSSGLHQYNEIPQEKYPDFVERTLKECWRVMNHNSWLIMWFAHEPWMAVIRDLLEDAGFRTSFMVGIWDKKKPGQNRQPERNLASSYEMFYIARKGDPKLNIMGRGNMFSFEAISPNRKVHPTERPIELIQDILNIFLPTGARILVPFAGSGNTILAAANLRMNAVGFDLSSGYKDAYVNNVMADKPPFYNSKRVGDSAARRKGEGE